MKKKALLLAALFVVLCIPLALPARSQIVPSIAIEDPEHFSPVVIKSDGKVWVNNGTSSWATVGVQYTITPSGAEAIIVQVNLFIETTAGNQNLTVTTSPSASDDYDWDVNASAIALDLVTGDHFNLTYQAWESDGSEYNSSTVTVYFSETVPVEDPTVTVDPVITSAGGDLYVRGEFTVEWEFGPSTADWLNVSVMLFNTTPYYVINWYATPSNWTTNGFHYVNSLWHAGVGIDDGNYTLTVLIYDQTTVDDPVTSLPGNTTMELIVANGYYVLTSGASYVAMPLVSTESEAVVEGVANIFFAIGEAGLDPDDYGVLYGNGTFIDAEADLAWSNFTLRAPNGTLVESNRDSRLGTRFSDWGLSSAWWFEVDTATIGYMYTVDSAEYPDGTWDGWLYVEDLMGYYLNITVTFEADNTVPVVNITSPADGAEVTGDMTVQFTITEALTQTVTISIGGVETDLVVGDLNTTGGTNSYVFDTTTVGDGELAIEINVEDNNLLGSDSIAVTVVNTRNTANDFYSQGMILGLGVGIPIFLLIGYALGSALMRGKMK